MMLRLEIVFSRLLMLVSSKQGISLIGSKVNILQRYQVKLKKPNKNAPLKEQEAYYYQLLKNEGFDDIEDTGNEFRPLVEWDSIRFRKLSRNLSTVEMDAT